ncbi:hypothetical protein AMTRI_Chr13g86010 [Amborella trichopoda]
MNSMLMGGPSSTVKLRQRDSATARKSDAGRELPIFTAPLDGFHFSLRQNGTHTRCSRRPSNRRGSILAVLNVVTPTSFDNNYFKILIQKKGLLESDQLLFNGGSTDEIVRSYSKSRSAFCSDFA